MRIKTLSTAMLVFTMTSCIIVRDEIPSAPYDYMYCPPPSVYRPVYTPRYTEQQYQPQSDCLCLDRVDIHQYDNIGIPYRSVDNDWDYTKMWPITMEFTLNSAELNNSAYANCINISKWLNSNPNGMVTLCCYADKGTGTAKYNRKLARERGLTIYEVLTKYLNVSSSRIEIIVYGSDSQHYSQNDLNRCVIIKARNRQ